MMKKYVSGAVALLSVMATGSSYAGDVQLHCGRLLDVEALKVRPETTITISGNRISSIEKGYVQAENAQIIDLTDSTCMPGLMDMHVHLEFEYSPHSRLHSYTLDDSDLTINALVNARKDLAAGFTTVRDLGSSRTTVSALRNAINKGKVPGPRIYAATKSIATTGGHADPTNGSKLDGRGDPGPVDGVINGVEDAAKAVRQRYKDGADLIKITATGGVLSVAKSGQNPQFKDAELRAIIDTAKDYGMHVAAHAHGSEGMKRAVEAGIHSIEHGTFMTSEIMRLMKKNGTWYVPTLLAGAWVAEKAKIEGFFPELVVPKAISIGPKLQETFANAYKTGVKIAFGTDTGVSAHGDNAREFELMVRAGMPAIEAIRAATLSSAQLLGVEDKLGLLADGYIADIVAVKGDPTQDISLMKKMHFVMKDGDVYQEAAD